jgi:hypothetical protein
VVDILKDMLPWAEQVGILKDMLPWAEQVDILKDMFPRAEQVDIPKDIALPWAGQADLPLFGIRSRRQVPTPSKQSCACLIP